MSLTNKEFALLEHLMLNRGQCVSRVELLESVWNMEPAQTTNIVDVYVNYLRRKLEGSAAGPADPHGARPGIRGSVGERSWRLGSFRSLAVPVALAHQAFPHVSGSAAAGSVIR